MYTWGTFCRTWYIKKKCRNQILNFVQKMFFSVTLIRLVYTNMCVYACVWEWERVWVCNWEREREREREGEKCGCVIERERERGREVCVCVYVCMCVVCGVCEWERECGECVCIWVCVKEGKSVHVCVRVREREWVVVILERVYDCVLTYQSFIKLNVRD